MCHFNNVKYVAGVEGILRSDTLLSIVNFVLLWYYIAVLLQTLFSSAF